MGREVQEATAFSNRATKRPPNQVDVLMRRLATLHSVLEPVTSVWEKLDALGSVGGALLALGALIAATLLYRVESGRDKDARKAQNRRDAVDRRRQATSVAMWMEPFPAEGVDDVDHMSSMIYTVHMANYSSLPIHSVTIRFEDRDDIPYFPGGVGLTVMPPGMVHPMTIPVRKTKDQQRIKEELFHLEYRQLTQNELILIFTDNAGVTWIRQGSSLVEFEEI